MGALFNDLHAVAQVLAEHIADGVGIVDVQPGTPRDVTASTDAGARITLLYTTPQPGHRNDSLGREPGGARRFPPLSLSCFFLITTSGADNEDPIAAHNALGQIMTLYQDEAVLQLPLSDRPGTPPGTFSELGEGELEVVQVPMVLDQIDKIWTSLDVQLQPWALFEVAPVQLVSQRADLLPAPLVRPGGLGLEVRAGARPLIQRVAPEAVRARGRVRIDAIVQGETEAVAVDKVTVVNGDPSLTVGPGGVPLLLTLDDGGLEALGPGRHQLTVRARGLVSRSGAVRIVAAAEPAVDAPAALVHDPATDLVLTGANLTDAQAALLWPDAGVGAPNDVHTLPVSGVHPGSVTLPSAGGLATLPAVRGPWRLSVCVGSQVFTPYVVLELGT